MGSAVAGAYSRIDCLFSYLKNGREVFHFDSPKEAYDYANKLRERLSVDDKIRCMVSAEGHRVILAHRASQKDKNA